MRTHLKLTLIFSALFVLANCQKKEDSTSTFTAVYQNTLAGSCVQCHQPGGSATQNNNVQLNFTTQALAYSTLVSGNVNGATTVSQCPNVRIVSAGSPSTSYLLGTINQAYSSSSFAGVSGCTPYAGHYSTLNLSSDQMNGLQNWVTEGAQNN